MHSNNAPGLDDLNPGFYKQFWHLCGMEIFQEGVHWLEQGTFPPSQLNPTRMTDLRPICLYNVIYKIVAKVLANRMKVVLLQCISQGKYAFIENRSIVDNVLVAIEFIHHMKCKVEANIGEVALKIDISKTYDRVDWKYLQTMIYRLGLCDEMIRFIKRKQK